MRKKYTTDFPGYPFQCLQCDTTFYRTTSEINRGRTRFCGRSCAAKSMPRRPKMPRPLHSRFWEKVQKTDGCWLWTAYRNKKGYGTIGEGSREKGKIFAHVLSYKLHYGPVPKGLFVLHACDNPSCVRPDHLFVGTKGDNIRDAAAKGRLWMQTSPEKRPSGDNHWIRKHPERSPLRPGNRACGDQNGSRKHPERLRRGDDHPARLHPEYLARGVTHPKAKLDDDKVREIRTLFANSWRVTAIAHRFDVNPGTISGIVRGKKWRHVI